MTLREIVSRLGQFPTDQLILIDASLAAPEADAQVRARGPVPEGYRYLLEVDLALEVLDVWSAWREGRRPTADEGALAILHYAEHDAYEPV